ncbi:MAG: aspartate kinase [Omnitrophica bacterium RIFCSPLOWO2_02_FULL_45_16]|nr:MAG: aspartate kinase [Omnitrophica bacterium RIFCSPHIGHO2_02_FULL_46_20]OGW94906.1 MAG: aspartate kinase [Omnitrophica bacterium RIFCSPLOWO2_01_FULL_45_24]OGX01182.1 MAG: aspartate kinase [Omnitrophica bacterium RIFCSPLOWO2_02_FULL_45_16]
MSKGIVVQKYGGTSVTDIGRIKSVAKRVVNTRRAGYEVVVIVSALGHTTDKLIDLAMKITTSPPDRELDMLLSTGEQMSSALLAMAIHKLGQDAISFTGAQVGIVTDGSFTKARIIDINAKRIEEELKKGRIVIVAGFQGASVNQDITTLGRGGSNLTAVALAKVLNAKMCEMCTDVEGVFTADPRIVKNARKIDKLSYEEMFELASLGAQVLQPRSIEFAMKFGVPIHVRSSFSNKLGTIISKEVKAMEHIVVSGVALNKNEAKVTICDVPDKPGIAAKIFKDIAKENINVDMIIQNVSRTGATDVSFTVMGSELNKTIKASKDVAGKIGAGDVTVDKDIAKVSIVGIGMKSHSGVAADMFEALAEKSINIEMISTSEIKISCIVKKSLGEAAVRAIHEKFGLAKSKR